VKKFLQKIGLVSITLLYCLATGLYSNAAYAGNIAFSKQDDKATANYSHSVSAKSFQHTVQTENSITVCNHNNTVTVKNTYKEFSGANRATENLLFHTFSQYKFFSHKLLVSLQNTNLIFPFHYFW
jgi:hypothetical protein